MSSFLRISVAAQLLALAQVVGSLSAQSAQRRAKVPDSVPPYQAQRVVKGPIEIQGADELLDLGEEWSRGFKNLHPEANLTYRARLSKDAVRDFIAGGQLMILSARELTAEENAAFQGKHGYLPMRIPVCLDANIVFVHKSNPMTEITMEKLDAIYSKNRLGGAKAVALTWGDLGLRGSWAKQPIHAYARAEGTTTRTTFAAQAMLKGEYRDGIIPCEDPAALAEAVTNDPAGIAFGSMTSWYLSTKVIPVVPYRGTDARMPTQENVTTSRYPMPRLFYIYLNRTPGQPLPDAIQEVAMYLLSKEGQNAVADSGLLPGPPEFLTIARRRLSR